MFRFLNSWTARKPTIDDKSIRMYDEEQILDLLRRTQELEKQKSC